MDEKFIKRYILYANIELNRLTDDTKLYSKQEEKIKINEQKILLAK